MSISSSAAPPRTVTELGSRVRSAVVIRTITSSQESPGSSIEPSLQDRHYLGDLELALIAQAVGPALHHLLHEREVARQLLPAQELLHEGALALVLLRGSEEQHLAEHGTEEPVDRLLVELVVGLREERLRVLRFDHHGQALRSELDREDVAVLLEAATGQALAVLVELEGVPEAGKGTGHERRGPQREFGGHGCSDHR